MIFNKNYQAVFAVVVPLLVSVAWKNIDANPSLFVSDVLLSVLMPNRNRFQPLQGKTVWVTGASSGIGAELVCQLVEAGVENVVLSSRQVSKLRAVAEECKIRSESSSTVLSLLEYDATASNTSDLTVRTAMKLVGKPIDLVFLNAGRYQVKPALQTPHEEAREIMRVNYESPIELATSLILLDQWKERGYGHVVVTASILSHGGHSLSSSYVASKHALRGYFTSLSTEEFEWLRVDLVCPGAVATNMWNALNETIRSDDSLKVPVDRFVRLMLTGVVGPRWLFYETWISRMPGLLWTMLSSYFPEIFHAAVHMLGIGRLHIWKRSGGVEDALRIPDLLWAICEKVQDMFLG